MSETKLFQLIVALKRRCSATEERIQRELQINPGEFSGLLALKPSERVHGSGFSEMLGLSASRGSRVASMLADRGWITIDKTEEDRRSIYISLTSEGASTRRKLEGHLLQCEERLMSSFTKEQIEHIRNALSMLQHAL